MASNSKKSEPVLCPHCGLPTVAKGLRFYTNVGQVIRRYHCTNAKGCRRYHMRHPETGILIVPPTKKRTSQFHNAGCGWSVPMKLAGEAADLCSRAINSLVICIEMFNRPSEAGRTETVLIMIHHSFEMLLKAVILTATGVVHDPEGKYTYGFDRCLHILREASFLDENERIALSILDAHRDVSMHYYQVLSEDMLYLQAQSGVTLFGVLLERAFGKKIADILPSRILPISTKPPADLSLLVSSELNNVDSMIGAKRRKLKQAAASLRSILALAAGSRNEGRISESELQEAIERRRNGDEWAVIFPDIARLSIESTGTGLTIGLAIKKNAEICVRIAKDGESVDGTVIRRDVNILDVYNLSSSQIAGKLGLTIPKVGALILELKIKEDNSCFRIITRGSSKFPSYSMKALERMRSELENGLSIDDVWSRQKHHFGQKEKPKPLGLFD